MGKPNIKDFDRVLLVEGYSDLLFYAEVLEVLGKQGTVFIKDFNGKSDLTSKLEAFITPQLLADKKHIGVIVDADNNSQGTFASIQRVLTELTAQTVPSPGTWTTGSPKIGLFVAPDASAN